MLLRRSKSPMKIWSIIGIIVILGLVCSPVLAITKGQLIASYSGQSTPTATVTNPSWLPEWWLPEEYYVEFPPTNDANAFKDVRADSGENYSLPPSVEPYIMPSPTPAPTMVSQADLLYHVYCVRPATPTPMSQADLDLLACYDEYFSNPNPPYAEAFR
jgi:hypothetical protein